jgi:hypothetical protein
VDVVDRGGLNEHVAAPEYIDSAEDRDAQPQGRESAQSEEESKHEVSQNPLEASTSHGDRSSIHYFWEAKKQNFIKFKLWEDDRFLQVSRHRKLLNNI